MAKLVELTPASHRNLKVIPNSVMKLAKNQHMINLRVNELGPAASSFPIFITRLESQASWVLSAITALQPEDNLFVENEEWQAAYLPSSMQTYPFQVMQSPHDEKKYTIGIDPDNDAFSEQEGEALFEDERKASVYLSQVSALLEANIKNDIQTFEFTRKIEEFDLLKEVDVRLEYVDGTFNTLKGLHSLDEDKLRSLSSEQFEELRNMGYLAPIYAILISAFQLNALHKKHNLVEGSTQVKQMNMGPAKNFSDL